MQLIEFTMTKDDESSHIQIDGAGLFLVKNNLANLNAPHLKAEDVIIFLLGPGTEKKEFPANSGTAFPVHPEMAFLNIIDRLTVNDSTEVKVISLCKELEEYLACFKKFPAARVGERTIPYFATDGRQLLHLAVATERFLFYKNDFDEAFMYETASGKLISNNEFADMGLDDITRHIILGKEAKLPFQEYPQEDILAELEKTSLSVIDCNYMMQVPDQLDQEDSYRPEDLPELFF